MREHLLGYLMGALDASQQKEVEQALEHDPQLRRELELLDYSLEPLRADRGLLEPPPGLADRTLDVVAAVAGWPEEEFPTADDSSTPAAPEQKSGNSTAESRTGAEALPPAAGRHKEALTPARDPALRSWADRWALLDVLASAGIVAAAAMLFFPAIANSRFQARVMACQENLRSLARALENYSERHQDQFVPIPVQGNLSFAGVYAPSLRDGQYVVDEEPFFCPADLAARSQASGGLAARPRIPSLEEIERAQGALLRRLQRLAGGSYGYNLGYLVDGEYSPVRNERRPTFALLADAPGPQRQGRLSLHHEGRGQNVLFEDLHIKFLPDDRVGDADEIFFSDRGLIEAGRHRDDTVIGSSHSRPLLLPTAW